MRDYSKVAGSLWTGKTGKALRGDMEAQIVAMYLMTSPHANMIGVYFCPIHYISYETGLPLEGASKGLHRLIEGGFCTYVDETEMVWVHEMAKYQIDEQLRPTDNRVKGIQKAVDCIKESEIRKGFLAKYSLTFHLSDEGTKDKPLESPLQAPTKPEAGTGTETETTTPSRKRDGGFNPIAFMLDNGVDEAVASDWIAFRRRIKASVSKTVLTEYASIAAEVGVTLEKALRVQMRRNWQGMEASWFKGDDAKPNSEQPWFMSRVAQ